MSPSSQKPKPVGCGGLFPLQAEDLEYRHKAGHTETESISQLSPHKEPANQGTHFQRAPRHVSCVMPTKIHRPSMASFDNTWKMCPSMCVLQRVSQPSFYPFHLNRFASLWPVLREAMCHLAIGRGKRLLNSEKLSIPTPSYQWG